MTKAAFVFIGAGVAVYLVASQTQVGWLYLFDAIIWSLLALSAVLPGYSLKSLKVEQQVLLPPSHDTELPLNGPQEDETIEVRLKVSNLGRFTRYFITLAADCPFEQPEARRKSFLLAALKPGSPAVFPYSASCYHRGYYALSKIILQSGGPLGLIVRKRSFNLPLNLTVYPAYYRMEKLLVAGEEWAEWGHNAKSNAASEFYGSRNYQPGDPLKRVHWRNTARVGHFMIKEFEQAGQDALTVILDTSGGFGQGRETTLEYGIKITASLAALLARFGGRSIDLVNAGQAILHNADWQMAMDFLACLTVTGENVPADARAASSAGGAMVIIVPAVVTNQTPALAQLARQGRGALVILDGFAPDERPEEVISLFKDSGLQIIHGSRGNLEATVNTLSDSVSIEVVGGVL